MGQKAYPGTSVGAQINHICTIMENILTTLRSLVKIDL